MEKSGVKVRKDKMKAEWPMVANNRPMLALAPLRRRRRAKR